MPVFTATEYRDHDARPDWDAAFARLPVLLTVDGLGVRWVGPLVELNLARRLSDLTEAAWGYLESSGWQDLWSEGGKMLHPDGTVRPAWAEAFGAAARRLAEEGSHAGPESDPEVWAAWLGFEMSGIHGWLKAEAERRGVDR